MTYTDQQRVTLWCRCISWLDHNPRVGWYWFVLLLLNTILNILDLFK